MALVNRAWREGVFVPPGAEPGLTLGRDWRETTEARAVQDIARQRFNYPNAQEPDLSTSVNLPQRAAGVRTSTGEMLFPDIVVLDSHTTEARMVAEVETLRSLAEASDMVEKWRAFASVAPFYLFVPVAQLDQARAHLKKGGIRPAGLRVWRHMAGLGYTDVVDVRS